MIPTPTPEASGDVAMLADLVREVMGSHSHRDSAAYQECDTAPCLFCEHGRQALAALDARPSPPQEVETLVMTVVASHAALIQDRPWTYRETFLNGVAIGVREAVVRLARVPPPQGAPEASVGAPGTLTQAQTAAIIDRGNVMVPDLAPLARDVVMQIAALNLSRDSWRRTAERFVLIALQRARETGKP